MKKFLKLLKNSLLFILALVTIMVMFLFVYYEIRANRIEKQEKPVQADLRIRTPQFMSPEISVNPVSLNLLPVPKSVEMRPGIFHIPIVLTFRIEPSLRFVAEKFLNRSLATRAEHRSSGAFLN